MQELIEKAIQWGEERGIFEHSNPTKQLMKSASELGEMFDAFAKEDWEQFKCETGDFIVTLILLSEFARIPFFIRTRKEATNDFSFHFLAELHERMSYLMRFEVNSHSDFIYSFNSLLNCLGRLTDSINVSPEQCLALA